MKIEQKVRGIMVKPELLEAGDAFVDKGKIYLVIDKGDVNVGNHVGVLTLDTSSDKLYVYSSTEKVEQINVSLNIRDMEENGICSCGEECKCNKPSEPSVTPNPDDTNLNEG